MKLKLDFVEINLDIMKISLVNIKMVVFYQIVFFFAVVYLIIFRFRLINILNYYFDCNLFFFSFIIQFMYFGFFPFYRETNMIIKSKYFV